MCLTPAEENTKKCGSVTDPWMTSFSQQVQNKKVWLQSCNALDAFIHLGREGIAKKRTIAKAVHYPGD